MEPDPIGLKAGLNIYTYVLNDPINKTDASGLYAYVDGHGNWAENGLNFNGSRTGNPFTDQVANHIPEAVTTIAGGSAISRIAEKGLAALGLFGRASAGATTVDGEVFYRTMSQGDYANLLGTGRLSATGETFISPSLEYAQKYSGVMVQFEMQPGTLNALAGIGVRDSAIATRLAFPEMQTVSSGWGTTSAYFKTENDILNIGLGRGAALTMFNDMIINFGVVP